MTVQLSSWQLGSKLLLDQMVRAGSKPGINVRIVWAGREEMGKFVSRGTGGLGSGIAISQSSVICCSCCSGRMLYT